MDPIKGKAPFVRPTLFTNRMFNRDNIQQMLLWLSKMIIDILHGRLIGIALAIEGASNATVVSFQESLRGRGKTKPKLDRKDDAIEDAFYRLSAAHLAKIDQGNNRPALSKASQADLLQYLAGTMKVLHPATTDTAARGRRAVQDALRTEQVAANEWDVSGQKRKDFLTLQRQLDRRGAGVT
ncbi:MAG: hypothetical protein Q9167_000400 [Letrouitia subvulpina]